MKCPKCRMTIPNGAEICPYCRSKQNLSFGVFGDAYDGFKEVYKKGSANNGCMVVLPLILIVVSSIFYIVKTYV